MKFEPSLFLANNPGVILNLIFDIYLQFIFAFHAKKYICTYMRGCICVCEGKIENKKYRSKENANVEERFH